MTLAFFILYSFSLLPITATFGPGHAETKKAWLVRVETVYHSGTVSTCMGAIISEQWVMMAPQCASRDGLYTSFKTAVGIHTKPEGWGPQGYSINLRTPLFYREHYEINGNNYTIAFAKLSGYQVQTTRNVVEPIKILTDSCDREGLTNVCQGRLYVVTVDEEVKQLTKQNPSECGLGNGEVRKWCLSGATHHVNSTEIMQASPVFCKMNGKEDVAVGIIHEAAGMNRVSMFKLCDVTKWIEAQIDYNVGIPISPETTTTVYKSTDQPSVTIKWETPDVAEIITVEWGASYEPTSFPNSQSTVDEQFPTTGHFSSDDWTEEVTDFTSTQVSTVTEMQGTTQATVVENCDEPPRIAAARPCRTSWSFSDGVKTDTAIYCCLDGSEPQGPKKTAECTNYNANQWTLPNFKCSGDECGLSPTPFPPFTQPKSGSQCNSSATGPRTRCLTDVASELVPLSIGEIVDRHNCWRQKVDPPARNMPELQWDDELAQLAERWAAQCPEGHDSGSDRALPHRQTNGISWEWVGQNICWHSANQSFSDCIDQWVFEKNDFNYGQGPRNVGDATGHYTQAVADRTYFIGCGQAFCPNNLMMGMLQLVQVCNYAPGGNFNNGTAYPYARL